MRPQVLPQRMPQYRAGVANAQHEWRDHGRHGGQQLRQAGIAEAEVRPEHEQLQINELPSGLIILLGTTARSPKLEATVVEAQQFATEMLQNRS